MGKITGFLEYERAELNNDPAVDRVRSYQEFTHLPADEVLHTQGARCMDCGIPFCHNGCPVNNLIPDWNDLIYQKDWKTALDTLHSTNNFPEFTGRICPAPCEEACTLNLEGAPVTIKNIERAIIDHAWQQGWVQPQIAAVKTGKKVAVVGSGPAGLACAQQLARAGHEVHLFEKNHKMGGLMRYGIPDFKLDKTAIDRRLQQMQAEGVVLHPDTQVGGTGVSASRLLADFEAIALTGGSEQPRDLPMTGRELNGVHFAMDFLSQQNRRVSDESLSVADILATDKDVVVIGGGDTGSDCIGTSNRQGARSVTQLEIMPKPPEHENKALTWPNWPMKLRTSTSHEEGCERDWSVATKRFIDDGQGNVSAIECVRVDWQKNATGQWVMEERAGSLFTLPAQRVFLAMGFVHPVHEGLLDELAVAHDGRGNVQADTEQYQTSVNKVFAAGDMRRGQSLVVWAIREGRQCAQAVDTFLMGSSDLPR